MSSRQIALLLFSAVTISASAFADDLSALGFQGDGCETDTCTASSYSTTGSSMTMVPDGGSAEKGLAIASFIFNNYNGGVSYCVNGFCSGQSGVLLSPWTFRLPGVTLTCNRSTACAAIFVTRYSDVSSIPTGQVKLSLTLGGSTTGASSGYLSHSLCAFGTRGSTANTSCGSPLTAYFATPTGGGTIAASAAGAASISGPQTLKTTFYLDSLAAGASITLPTTIGGGDLVVTPVSTVGATSLKPTPYAAISAYPPLLSVRVTDFAQTYTPTYGFIRAFQRGDSNQTFNVTISNLSGSLATSTPVQATIALSSGLALAATPFGSGWSCSGLTCTNSTSLSGGASYPPITVQVNVANDAGTLVSVTASVTGGASNANSPKNADPVPVLPPAPSAPTNPSPADGATGVSTASPVLTWTAPAGTASYQVFFGTNPNAATLAGAPTTNSFTAPVLTPNTKYYWRVVAINATGDSRPTSATWSFTTTGSGVTPPGGLRFIAVAPCRVIETRSGQPGVQPTGVFGPPTMAAGETRSFPIPQGGCHIPSTAKAYSMNVTVVAPAFLGYLSMFPSDQPQPVVSTLNAFNGGVVSNAAIVPASATGAISIYVSNRTDVFVDINGYFDSTTDASSLDFYSATPCRIADTRLANGTFGGPNPQANETRTFPIPQSSCGIPATAKAFSTNVTVQPPGPLYYLTLWGAGNQQPVVSTLNSFGGLTLANAAIVPAGLNGGVSAFVTNPTAIILDINGYFAAPGSANALNFYPVTPCRVADTRNPTGPFGGPVMAANTSRSFAIQSSSCGIPPSAQAYSLNITVQPLGYLGYLTTWPSSQAQPFVSTLNSLDGSTRANAAIVPAGTAAGGAVSVFVTNQTDVIIDINGYFAP